MARLLLLAPVALALLVAVATADVSFKAVDYKITIGTTTYPTLAKSTVLYDAPGSAATARPGAPFEFYSADDRGPNIQCGGDSTSFLGSNLCAAVKLLNGSTVSVGSAIGRIFPYKEGKTPAIYHWHSMFAGEPATLVKIIPIKDTVGTPVSGFTPPLTAMDGDTTNIDSSSNQFATDPNGIDNEALAALSDGTFLTAEEYGPSMLHIAADGTILDRMLPNATNLDGIVNGATYPTSKRFPGLLAKRRGNRGFEAMCVTADEQFVWVGTQSPLYNPSSTTGQASRLLRYFKMAWPSKTLVGEYLYVLDLAGSVSWAQDTTTVRPQDLKVSELICTADPNVVVFLERTDLQAKLYRVDFSSATNILGTQWDSATQSPTLESIVATQSGDPATLLAAYGLVAGVKTARANSAVAPWTAIFPPKTEGVARLANNRLLVMNDNDFNVDMRTTTISNIKSVDVLTDYPNFWS